MMKMAGRVTSCCVALLLVLTSVKAVQKHLDSIDDLKEINFGQSVPKHSLVLLYWFANTVDIDDNDVIWLTFDPNNGDYDSHYYGNFEELLDRLPQGNAYQYYTVGNLGQKTSMPLPPYVVRPPTEDVGRNRDRIIIRVREQNTGWRARQRIDQVYITQHYGTSEHQGSPYDPNHTYRITTNLLRQIREFSVGENQQRLLQLRNRYGSNADDSQLRHMRNTWGELACLGLLLFIVIQDRYSSNQNNSRHENRINHWALESNSNVSRDLLNQGSVVLDMNDDHEASRTTGNRESGNASVHLIDQGSFCQNLICCILLFLFLFIWYKFS